MSKKTTGIKKVKAICIVRAHSKNNFELLLNQMKAVDEYYVSHEYLRSKSDDKSLIIDAKPISVVLVEEMKWLPVEDVIKRDRMLRNLRSDIAIKIVNSVSNQIHRYIERVDPDVIFGQLVDYYILDIYYRIAERRGIDVISIMSGFVDRTFALSRYGELTPINSKAIDFFEFFENRNQPDFVSCTDKMTDIKLLISGVKKTLKNVFNRFKHGRQYRSYDHFVRCNNSNLYHKNQTPLAFLSSRYFEELDSLLCVDKDNTIYLAMHFYPEAVIDYWIEDVDLIQHDEIIFEMFEYNPDVKFIVKEHPAMYGRRAYSFYKKMNSFSNVTILNPHTRTFEIFDRIDYVLTWTGTVGVEALFAGKKVITVEKPFYYVPEIAVIDNRKQFKNIGNLMQKAKAVSGDNLKYLNEKLSVSFSPPGNIESINEDEISEMARVLSKYLERQEIGENQ